MANLIDRLRLGVAAWNDWKRVNHGIEIDFSGADLSNTNLIGADFSGVNLCNANLRDANLRSADLSNANLIGADFSGVNLRDANFCDANLTGIDLRNCNLTGVKFTGANLSDTNFKGSNLNNTNFGATNLRGANLFAIRALGANFAGATLTGACIEDWNINSDTALDGVICKYVYLKENQEERRPLTGTFNPGDFAKLVQKVVSTVDLIFRDGINWEAFAQSFDQLRAEAGTDDLAIQAIENKGYGSFIIRVNTPPGADNAKIQQFLEQQYQKRLKVIEARYRTQLQAKDEQLDTYRQENTNLWEITKLLASKPPSVTQNIGTAYGVSGHTEGDQNIHPPQES